MFRVMYLINFFEIPTKFSNSIKNIFEKQIHISTKKYTHIFSFHDFYGYFWHISKDHCIYTIDNYIA